MTNTEKHIMNEDNIIQVRHTSILLSIFMSDTLFLYMSNEGCFKFYYLPFCMFYDLNKIHIKRKNMKKASIYTVAPVNIKPRKR